MRQHAAEACHPSELVVGLDREGLAARDVNLHRQVLANVFEYATRADSFALPANPVRGADKRREDYSKPPETLRRSR